MSHTGNGHKLSLDLSELTAHKLILMHYGIAVDTIKLVIIVN